MLKKHFRDEEVATVDFCTLMYTLSHSVERDMYTSDLKTFLPAEHASADINLLQSFVDAPETVSDSLVSTFLLQLRDSLSPAAQ